jgi:hypothetical protein
MADPASDEMTRKDQIVMVHYFNTAKHRFKQRIPSRGREPDGSSAGDRFFSGRRGRGIRLPSPTDAPPFRVSPPLLAGMTGQGPSPARWPVSAGSPARTPVPARRRSSFPPAFYHRPRPPPRGCLRPRPRPSPRFRG